MNPMITEESTALAIPAADASNPLAILQSALERGTDPAKLEKLMDLADRWKAQKAEEEFNAAMNAAQQQMPCVVKDGLNTFTKGRYATLETVNQSVKPVYAMHGFSLSFSEEDSPKGVDWCRVVCDISHTGGHTRRRHVDMPLDTAGMKGGANKSGAQSIGSTLTYARRYLTLLIFNVTVANEDLDGQSAAALDTITEADALEIEDLIADKGVNLPKFLEWAQVKSIRDITQKNLAKVLDTLNRKKGPGDR